jgi:hypothetical protein
VAANGVLTDDAPILIRYSLPTFRIVIFDMEEDAKSPVDN